MKWLTITLLVMGFSGMTAQIILLRELLTVFYGNELSIGVILSGWLMFEALGAYAFRKKTSRPFKPDSFVLMQFLFALILPLTIYTARIIKHLMSIPPGEGAGFVSLALASLALLLPVCFAHGALFTSGCNLYSSQRKMAGKTDQETDSATSVYVLEALGTLAGAACVTFFLIPFFNAFQIAFAVSAINLALCVALMVYGRVPNDQTPVMRRHFLSGLSAVFCIVSLALLAFNGANAIHHLSIDRQWAGHNIVLYHNSIYENIAVGRKENQYTFYTGGLPSITVPDPDILTVEANIHFPLLSHAAPETALLLSGGAGGAIRETLKHPVKRIDYVEIDPELLRIIRMFPTPLTVSELSDERVNINFSDGRLYMKETPVEYDVIIIGMDMPSDLQSNRLFTAEFFGMAAERLSADGVLALTLPGSLSYLDPELKKLHVSILSTLQHVFRTVHVIPGDTTHYLAGPGDLLISQDILSERFHERSLETEYFDPFYIEYRLHERRIQWFFDSVRNVEAALNLDFTPAAVFYSLRYHNALFSPSLNTFLDGFETPAGIALRLGTVFAVLFIVFGSAEKLLFRRKDTIKNVAPGMAVNFTAITTGFAGMIFDIAFIFMFQALYGYVFYWIGILVSIFMAGTVSGSRLAALLLARTGRKPIPLLIKLDMALIVFAFLPAVLFLAPGLRLFDLPAALIKTVFLVLCFCSGMLTGAQFPAAVDLYRRWSDTRNTMPSSAGLIYAGDLVGGCAGGIIAGVVLLPLAGLPGTLMTLIVLKILSLMMLTGVALTRKHQPFGEVS